MNYVCFRRVGISLGNRIPGRGPIWLDDLACTGRETHLFNCRHNGWGVHNCGHYEDVFIDCSNVRVTGKVSVVFTVVYNLLLAGCNIF